MPFRIALSGLNAAQADLNVTANNIANSVDQRLQGLARRIRRPVRRLAAGRVHAIATGNGVRVSDVAQQFAQGNIEFTDSNLDLAISGPGFFTLSATAARWRTRAPAPSRSIATATS